MEEYLKQKQKCQSQNIINDNQNNQSDIEFISFIQINDDIDQFTQRDNQEKEKKQQSKTEMNNFFQNWSLAFYTQKNKKVSQRFQDVSAPKFQNLVDSSQNNQVPSKINKNTASLSQTYNQNGFFSKIDHKLTQESLLQNNENNKENNHHTDDVNQNENNNNSYKEIQNQGFHQNSNNQLNMQAQNKIQSQYKQQQSQQQQKEFLSPKQQQFQYVQQNQSYNYNTQQQQLQQQQQQQQYPTISNKNKIQEQNGKYFDKQLEQQQSSKGYLVPDSQQLNILSQAIGPDAYNKLYGKIIRRESDQQFQATYDKLNRAIQNQPHQSPILTSKSKQKHKQQYNLQPKDKIKTENSEEKYLPKSQNPVNTINSFRQELLIQEQRINQQSNHQNYQYYTPSQNSAQKPINSTIGKFRSEQQQQKQYLNQVNSQQQQQQQQIQLQYLQQQAQTNSSNQQGLLKYVQSPRIKKFTLDSSCNENFEEKFINDENFKQNFQFNKNQQQILEQKQKELSIIDKSLFQKFQEKDKLKNNFFIKKSLKPNNDHVSSSQTQMSQTKNSSKIQLPNLMYISQMLSNNNNQSKDLGGNSQSTYQDSGKQIRKSSLSNKKYDNNSNRKLLSPKKSFQQSQKSSSKIVIKQ